ncbi:7207_t:CDS:2 [Paraglomus brasilianum]|uniref:7207_t:CDS:1 n=1 Tax=Paraglomus brasilianum TaxID=144538 RepID=A0A9N9AZG3_9GLOM|nr:7207_t:CDS:2 [Paraglomus brasilianum]
MAQQVYAIRSPWFVYLHDLQKAEEGPTVRFIQHGKPVKHSLGPAEFGKYQDNRHQCKYTSVKKLKYGITLSQAGESFNVYNYAENNLKETKEREKWKRGCEDGFFQTDAEDWVDKGSIHTQSE